jgi:thymidylate synthase
VATVTVPDRRTNPLTAGYHLETDTLRGSYAAICQSVVRYGSLVAPRGYRTRELLNPTIVVHSPEDCLPVGTGRKVSTLVGAVEAAQLCGSYSDPELTVAASPEFERYREPYTRQFHGAYGTRVKGQAALAVAKLRQDLDTRQAVITLWSPSRDNLWGKRDYPCTVSLQFLVREGRLLLVTNMRSNDVWLGLAYDLFQFGQLQWTVASELGIPAGPLVHRPVSLHAYEHNWDAISGLHESRDATFPNLYGFTSLNRAEDIARGRKLGDEEVLSPTDGWFVGRLGVLRDRMERARETS